MVELLNRYIYITFQKAGFHYYKDAEENVKYLKSLHRHLFKFKIKVQVFTDDRDIEFHTLLNEVELWLDSSFIMDGKSCEMLSDDLAENLEKYLNSLPGEDTRNPRKVEITVSEDGECGSICEYLI